MAGLCGPWKAMSALMCQKEQVALVQGSNDLVCSICWCGTGGQVVSVDIKGLLICRGP